MRQRYYFIDIVRALSLIGVIAVHTYSYHLSSPFNVFIWNSLQFVVIAFVFCSGFVLKTFDTFNLPAILSWLKKRFIRLYIPFIMYFLVHYCLFLLFPHIFYHVGLQRSFS